MSGEFTPVRRLPFARLSPLLNVTSGMHHLHMYFDSKEPLPFSDYTPFYNISFTHRTRKDIVMPLSEPIQCTDGTTMSEVPVPAGTNVVIAIQPANVIKELWGDDALEFKPERWLSPAPKALTDARIPGVYSNL